VSGGPGAGSGPAARASVGVAFKSMQNSRPVGMGFGSYDESEQGNHDIETDLEAAEGSRLATHDGEVEFEYEDASTEDLLETFEEIQGQ